MTKLDLLFRAIETHTGFKKSDLMTRSKTAPKSLHKARFIAMTIARNGLGFSLVKTAGIFQRERSSVQFAIRKVCNDPDMLVKAIIIQAEIISALNADGRVAA